MAKTKSTKQTKPVGTGARLTEDQVAKIKELRKADPEKWTFMALAERFKCTDGTAYRAVTGGAPRKPKAAKKAKAVKGPKPLKLAPKPKKAKKAKAETATATVVDEGDAPPVAAS